MASNGFQMASNGFQVASIGFNWLSNGFCEGGFGGFMRKNGFVSLVMRFAFCVMRCAGFLFRFSFFVLGVGSAGGWARGAALPS
jgi:hypothetical protein